MNFNNYLPSEVELKDYQHVGIAYSLVTGQPGKGVIIGDEQGLGKSVQAIVAARVRGCKKVLVVCKAALRGNWVHEYEKFAPDLCVEVLRGSPYEVVGDVAIISYDELKKWTESIQEQGFDCLIVDESHCIKSLGTDNNPVLRTRAVLRISANIRSRSGFVMLLTGTVILNRPIELISQLEAIGRLEEIAPLPRKGNDKKAWIYSFKFRYCGAHKTDSGYWQFTGHSNSEELNEKLRSTCYIRRNRKEVLGMNETTAISLPLSLNGALDTYRRAEDNFINFLMDYRGEEAASRAMRAEAITRINTLRNLAGHAKIGAAVEWIEDFQEENPGKKLVVFAWHKDVQKQIAAQIPGSIYFAGYAAGTAAQEEAKRRFNEDDDIEVIVCSLQAHREGHTFVGNGHNVTDVLFVENPWHYGAKSQAQDRINRIGQLSEHTFATTLLAEGADIDIWLDELVESKRLVCKAVAEGSADIETEEFSIQDEIIWRYRQRAAQNNMANA